MTISPPSQDHQQDTQPSTQAEEYLLAAVFDDPRLLDTIEFNPRDFHQPRHEDIWQAMARLHAARKPVDPLTVTDELNRHTQAGHRVDVADMHRLNNGAIVATAGHYYAGIVRREAQRRRIIHAAQQMLATAQTGDPEQVLEQASATMEGLQQGIHSQDVKFIGEDIDAVIDTLDQAPHYTPTPWPSLNQRIGGFLPGAMYVIGARPASGKSIWGLQAAIGLAEHGSVAYVSLEMSRYDLQKRYISNIGHVDNGHLMRHDLTEWDWEQIARARPKLQQLPIAILDRNVTITQMRRYIRSVHRRKPLAGIVLDYLGILQAPSGDRRSKHEYISAMSRELKQLAMQLEVPVIVLAQLNRESEKREDKTPRVSDLRDSGSVEQDADVVILLHRNDEQPTEVQMIVGKNRRGSTGSIAFDLKGYYSKITETGAAA
jgi:replicative DNA helicase